MHKEAGSAADAKNGKKEIFQMNATPMTPETPAFDTTKAFTPIRGDLALKVNEKAQARLAKLGFTLDVRTPERERQLRQEQEDEAKRLGRRPYRGNRTDGHGNPIPDSGTPVFGWGKEGKLNVLLARMPNDFEACGLRLVRIEHFVKPEGVERQAGGKGGTYSTLRFVYGDGPEVTLTPEQRAYLAERLRLPVRYTYVFRNPDGSVTVNASHFYDGPAESVLRMNSGGHFRSDDPPPKK